MQVPTENAPNFFFEINGFWAWGALPTAGANYPLGCKAKMANLRVRLFSFLQRWRTFQCIRQAVDDGRHSISHQGPATKYGCLFTIDEGSDPSMLGAGYLRSDNGSEGYALTFNLAFLDNRWSIGATYLDADIDYDLITSFGDVPINQKGELIKVKLMYGITPDFHLGISARYLESTIGSSNPIFPNLPSNIQLPNGFSTTGIGLLADYSTVDDKIYPTPVFNLAFSSTYNEPSGRFGEDYVKSILTYDTYLPTRDTGVVAMRLVGCSAPGRVPFYDLCSLGGTDAFRGFNITQFLDNALLSTQIEYRKRLGKRIGVVAFGGVGAVGGGLWVTSERLNRRTCPSESCGVVGQLFFREGVTVHEERDGCAEGMSQREAARHSCPPLTLKKAQ